MRRIELIMSDMFGYSSQTYFNWKKEIDKRPIIKLLEKYFSKEELEEFLKTEKIDKLERLNELLEIEKKYNQIIKVVEGK